MKVTRLTGESAGGLLAGAGLGMQFMLLLAYYGLAVRQWAFPMILGCGFLLVPPGSYMAQKAKDLCTRQHKRPVVRPGIPVLAPRDLPFRVCGFGRAICW
jgi:hypothetical protein